MSVSFTQNFLNPPPVPEMPTGTRTSGNCFWNSSATAWVMGPTVLEPSTRTVPEMGPAGGVTSTITPFVTATSLLAACVSPQAASTAAPAAARDPNPAARRTRRRLIALTKWPASQKPCGQL